MRLALLFCFACTTQGARLTIVHTNDVHSRLLPVQTPGEATLGGVANRKALIDRLRAEGDVLLVDAGNFSTGTLAAEFRAHSPVSRADARFVVAP